MNYSKISVILRAHRGVVLVSIALSLIFGIVALFYPIPYVSTLSLSNNTNYFSIKELKIIKNKLPTISPLLLEREQDERLRKILTKITLDPKWIEKNITPSYTIAKADSKDLLDPSKIVPDPSTITWVNIQTTGKDEEESRKQAIWIAKIICMIGFKEKIFNFINSYKIDADAAISANAALLPNLYKRAYQIEGDIKILNETKSKYPEIVNDGSKTLFNFNLNESKDDLTNISRLSGYFPVVRQLAIMETELLSIRNNISLAKIEIDVHESARKIAYRELEFLDTAKVYEIIQGNEVKYSFSQKLGNASDLEDNALPWLRSYVGAIKNNLRLNELTLGMNFKQEISALNNIFTETKYSRSLVIVTSLLLGLMLPALTVLVPKIFQNTVAKNFDLSTSK